MSPTLFCVSGSSPPPRSHGGFASVCAKTDWMSYMLCWSYWSYLYKFVSSNNESIKIVFCSVWSGRRVCEYVHCVKMTVMSSIQFGIYFQQTLLSPCITAFRNSAQFLHHHLSRVRKLFESREWGSNLTFYLVTQKWLLPRRPKKKQVPENWRIHSLGSFVQNVERAISLSAWY